MFPYWFAFAVPLFGFLFRARASREASFFFWGVMWFSFVLFIGLRHEVGGDWFSYINHFDSMSSKSLLEVLTSGDPGYYLIDYIVFWSGGSIHAVNVFCGAVLMAGVVRFANNQPAPILTLIVAVPYLIIVVGMGYARQSVALGFLLFGLVALSEGKTRSFVIWVLLGAAFHKSAVLMLPVAALASTRNRSWNVFWVGVTSLGAAYFFVFDAADTLWANYVEADYESQGGLVRVLMNGVPAIIFLVFRRHLQISDSDRKLWSWMALFALACIPLVLLSSTATDRVALYLIPLQLFVFARLHLIASTSEGRAFIVVGVVAYYALVQFVWLFFAANAFRWLPYQMYPFAS